MLSPLQRPKLWSLAISQCVIHETCRATRWTSRIRASLRNGEPILGGMTRGLERLMEISACDMSHKAHFQHDLPAPGSQTERPDPRAEYVP